MLCCVFLARRTFKITALGRAWNPPQAEWNQTEGLYGINPKADARYRVMPCTYGDYILTCGEITYQSFGLDRKKTVRKRSFFLVPVAGVLLGATFVKGE